MEPAFTTYHGKKGLTVDYIWVSDQVEIVGVWEMLPAQELEQPHSWANGRPFAGLPSKECGSDHLSLVTLVKVPFGNGKAKTPSEAQTASILDKNAAVAAQRGQGHILFPDSDDDL